MQPFLPRVPLALLALTGALLSAPVLAADLTVTVDQIEPGPGSIRVALYADADGFRHEDKAVAVLTAPATAATASVVFQGLTAGRYAAIAYHDANDNQKLDLTLGMFPNEGWGLSNDPTIIGPPRFSPSAFEVGETPASQTVHLHY